MDLIFDREYLKSLFAGDQEKRIAHVEKSLERANDYYSSNAPTSNNFKKTLQFEKDETIITLLTMAAIKKCGKEAWVDLLATCFPRSDMKFVKPEIFLEKAIHPSMKVQGKLKSFALTHPVNYIRKLSTTKRVVEGKTNFDAVLSLENGVNIYFEGKFTSDIDYHTTYITERNQIARCIEVGLEAVHFNVDHFYFVLVTPSRYKNSPGTRFYYYKMNEYQGDPKLLSRDIPSLASWYENDEKRIELEKLSDHISWITWEDCFMCINENNKLSVQEFASLKEFYSVRCLLPFQ